MQGQWCAVWEQLADATGKIDAILAGADDPTARAKDLAQTLRSQWPSSPLYGCQLIAESGPVTIALDGQGIVRPEWAELLQASLHCDQQSEHGAGPNFHPLPAPEMVPGHVLAVQSLTFRHRHQGCLLLAVPEDATSAVRSDTAALLNTQVSLIAPRLYLQTCEKEELHLRQELRNQTQRADLAELVGPVAHESNNFLNVIMLQLAILELDATETTRPQLAVIRRQANTFKGLIQHLQRLRQRLPANVGPTDLNQAVREAATDWQGPPVSLNLTSTPLPATGAASDLKCLIRFLIGGAAGLTGQGPVKVWIEATPGKAALRVQGQEPPIPGWGAEGLEWLACQGLARRLQGRLSWSEGAQPSWSCPWVQVQ